eukprot:Skav230896  [mRNA]  locus=scaffold2765:199618:204679:- [translate_table: standard]
MGAIRAEALRIAQAERAQGAVAPVAPVGAAAPGQGAVALVAGVPAAPHVAGQLKWLAAETAGGFLYGQEVGGVAAAMVKGSKQVYVTANNESVFVECVDGGDLLAFNNRPARCDSRILEVIKNGMGVPEAPLKDAIGRCKEVEVSWVLPGPRTANWCLQYLLVEGLGFEGHHERFRQVCKVDASAWGVQEHFQTSMSLRQALMVDQLDLVNLLSGEIQLRRLQTIEFSYAEKARELESRAVGGRLSLEEQTSFGGVTRQFATLMISPQLLEHVKSETEREASLAKNLRKAREEREATRKAAAKKKGLSRACQRRIQRRAHRQNGINETVDALNQLYDFGGGSGTVLADELVSAAQARSLEFIEECIEQLGPPGDVTGPGALEALRVTEGYEDLPSSSTLGSFDPALVSLPAGGVQPCDLADLWGEGGQMFVKEFISEQTVSEDAASQKLEAIGPRCVYTDPKLRGRRDYVKFLNQLRELNLIDFSIEEATETVGIFFVKKKQGRLRLILDCRRSNHWFKEPKHVALTTGESLRRVSVEANEKLYVCSADLANAFYTLSMPMELRRYFGLQRVKAGDLDITEVDGVPVQKTTLLQPRIAVLPMGWSWALYWCQLLHERIAERSGLLPEERLQDFKVAPSGGFWHVQYVDNLHVMGTNRDEVLRRFRRAVDELRRCGLTVHEVEELEPNTKILGWEYEDDGYFRPSRHRIWRLRSAIRYVLRRGRISGHQLERLLGHIAFASLGKREMFSMLGECYTFVQRHRSLEVPIWKSVRKELQCWERLSPLIVQNLASEVCTEVLAVDASEWGLGAVGCHFNKQEVKDLSGYNERWRFKFEETHNARQYTFMEDEKVRASLVEEFATDQPNKHLSNHASVPYSTVDRAWKLVGRVPWKKVESMPVLESRAALFGVKHFMRNTQYHGCKLLILTDSMTSACAVSKGRAQTWRLRNIIQKISALLLATGSSLCLRWIPSEWNASDGPSRGLTCPSKPRRRPDDDTLASSMCTSIEEENPVNEARKFKGHSKFDNKPKPVDLGHRDGGDQGSQQETPKGDEAAECTNANDAYGETQECGSEFGDKKSIREDVRCYDRVCDAEPTPDDHPTRDRLSGSHVPRDEVPRSLPIYAVPAITYYHPELKGTHMLAGTQQALKGWRKLCPPRARMPIPFEVVALLASYALKKHLVEVGLVLLLNFFLYLRPTEYRGIRVMDVVKPLKRGAGTYKWWSFLLHPHEAGVPSKTDQWDESLTLDLPYQQFLGPAIYVMMQLKTHNKSEPVFSVEPNEITKFLTESWQELKLEPLGVANSEVSEELREGQQNHPAVRLPGRQRAKKVPRGGQKPQPNLPRPALKPGRTLHAPVFLEIFSGSGRLGRSIARATGWFVLLWDIMLGADYDLTMRSNQHMLLGWVRSGLVVGAHLGVPCNSFSRARDQPGGPPPLRSDLQPLGLDDLRPGDALKVRIGNCLLRFSVRFMQLCLTMYVMCTLENPAKSRLWICPPMVHFLRRKAVQNVVTEFCAYGTAWRKSTRFIGVHIDLSPVGAMRCIGSKRGLCLFTGCPHLPLCGQNAAGHWLTKVAEPYPLKLCRLLSRCFLNHEIEQIARSFARHSGLP